VNTKPELAGPQIAEKTIAVWNGRIKMRVKVAGQGPALVYFHPASGLLWDPFLSYLARTHTVYAPEFPGTSAGDPYAIHAVQNLSDVVLVYEELLRALKVTKPVFVGQSFGGMLAAELASAYPDIASRLVLLDPIGLWRENAPVADWVSATPGERAALLFKNPTGDAARSMLQLPEDQNVAASVIAAITWAIGCTAKFAWPIPERGLRSRLHRLAANVLVVWGRDDALISSTYAEDWRREVKNCRSVLIDDCGHIPQVEKLNETVSAVSAFLAEA
jgi:pimeloyl-ACP methyl ester carboxylesterase